MAAWGTHSEDLVKHIFVVCGPTAEPTRDVVMCLTSGKPVSDAMEDIKKLWEVPGGLDDEGLTDEEENDEQATMMMDVDEDEDKN